MNYDEYNDVIFRRVENSFVQSTEALQKSAFVVDDSEGAGQLVAIDRINRTKPADYWISFLGAKRAVSDEDLTRQLERVTLQLGKECRDELPPEVRRFMAKKCFEYVEGHREFEEQVFLEAVCGPLAEDSPVRRKFAALLQASPLDGEDFQLVPGVLKARRSAVLHTAEGIKITIPETVRANANIFKEEGLDDVLGIELGRRETSSPAIVSAGPPIPERPSNRRSEDQKPRNERGTALSCDDGHDAQ